MPVDDLYDQLMRRYDADRIVARAREQLRREEAARQEFREWLTPSVKAEFINGEVVMHSPVTRGHLRASKCLVRIVGTYVDLHQLGEVDSEKALVEAGRNDYEPDVCFWFSARTDGWTKETLVHPTPDFVVEVLSKSTEANDRGVKFDSYIAYGCREYWIVDPVGEVIEQYVRRTDTEGEPTFELEGKLSGDLTVECRVIDGLAFPAKTAFSTEQSLAWVRDLLAP